MAGGTGGPTTRTKSDAIKASALSVEHRLGRGAAFRDTRGSTLDRGRQAEQYKAFRGEMKRLVTQVGDFQKQLSKLEQQVKLLAAGYREVASVLSGE